MGTMCFPATRSVGERRTLVPICDLGSVTGCVFGGHLADVHPECGFVITSGGDLLVCL